MDGRALAVTGGNYDGTVWAWDLTTGQTTATLAGHTAWVTAMAATEVDDRPVAVTCSGDGTARVWDLSAGTCLTTLRLPGRPECVEIAPNGTVVLGMGHEVIALTLAPLFRRSP
ncbi:hypothetical protein ACFQ6E_30340 [Streptomyces sp. NPDC056462]|uniref:hypothetical protein n=1 Tax=Streptomyces sp. NPDC056462 TaxID=3345826 RepID=UPI0036870A11